MNLRRSLVFAFAPLLLAAAARAESTVEERLKALEQQVQKLSQENTELKKELGWKEGATPPVVPRPGGKETKLIVGGFLQGHAEFGRAPDPRWSGVKDRFFFRRARIYLAGTIATDFDFKAELDLQGNTLSAGTGQLARANEIYLGWHRYAFANLRFGQIKPAYGAEQLASDLYIPVIERYLASDRLADGRQLGVSVGGQLLDKKVSYLAVVGNGNGANVSGNDNSKFQRSARVAFTPLATPDDKLVFGVNGLWADDTGLAKSNLGLTGNLFTGTRTQWGADAEWTHGPLGLSAEWLGATFKPVNAVPAASFDAEGWHATATYFVVPRTLQAVVRREAFDPNTALGGDTIRTWTFGLNYLIKGDDLKLMVDWLDGRVPGATNDGGRLLTRLQVVF
ncbi:MAG: hypothetical protein HYV95_07145 [Opitutae bacterium]|nr:hypothetical protein [Opitutae bacterium]